MATAIDKTADCPTYIGKKACGCIVCAAVDDPDHDKARKRDTAREVARWIREGLTVERVTVGFVRTCKFGCKCDE